jgi:hypothetical protein
MKARNWIALWSVLITAALLYSAQPLRWVSSQESQIQRASEFVWSQSLPIRSGDSSIAAIGGTEVRALVPFDNKLFAAIGYWMDTEKANPALPGAQVLRLDGPDSQWQVDLELRDRTPQGLRKYQAISTIEKVHFTTDSTGRKLDHPVDLLLAGVWKRGPGLDVFSRVTGSGFHTWSRIPIPGQEDAPRGTQIRAFFLHKDQITGGDIVFAGVTNGIFVGKYDRDLQNIVWNPQPEWKGDLAQPSARARVASFAECNGKLYATASSTLYERLDGSSPLWKKVFETELHAQSTRVTGFRSLTCILEGRKSGGVLLAGVEDNPSRIYRIDPREISPAGEYNATLELDVSSFLTRALATRATYAIVAYNNMTEYPDSARACSRLLLGLEAITPQASETFGMQHFNPHGHYLLRDCDGSYALRELRDLKINPEPPLVAVRALAVSPFQSDPTGTVYAGGFDTNRNPVHNTAWLYKGVPKAAAR